MGYCLTVLLRCEKMPRVRAPHAPPYKTLNFNSEPSTAPTRSCTRLRPLLSRFWTSTRAYHT